MPLHDDGRRSHLGLLRAQPRAARVVRSSRQPCRRTGREPALAALSFHDRFAARGLPHHVGGPGTLGWCRGRHQPGSLWPVRRPLRGVVPRAGRAVWFRDASSGARSTSVRRVPYRQLFRRRRQQHVAFTGCWDLHKVKPTFFPVPGAVVFGTTGQTHSAIPVGEREVWAGRLPDANLSWPDAAEHLSVSAHVQADTSGASSPYAPRFAQGATIVPRALFIVEDVTDLQPLGVGAGRRAVRSSRSPRERSHGRTCPTARTTSRRSSSDRS